MTHRNSIRPETPFGRTIIRGPLEHLPTPRASLPALIRGYLRRAWSLWQLRRLDREIGDARLDSFLAGLRADRAKIGDYPIATQLLEIHAWQQKRLKTLEARRTRLSAK